MITLYIHPESCPLCKEALKHIPKGTEVVNIDTVDGMATFCDNGGGTTLPLLIAGDIHYTGRDALVELLLRKGTLS